MITTIIIASGAAWAIHMQFDNYGLLFRMCYCVVLTI